MKKHRVQERFLDELRQVPIVRVACKKSGVSHNSIYRWRYEDPEFAANMDEALAEGEDFINDMTESQLLQLIKEKQFAAVRFWLANRHPKYKKQVMVADPKEDKDYETEEIIRALGLTEEDFKEENRSNTALRIADYLRNR